jgi:endonuclease/exonuclease/phosphatase family metal-dependent hydrolase
MRLLAILALLFGVTTPGAAETVRMIAFNIERGGFSDAELPTIVDLMDSVGPADVWAFSEASSKDADYLLKHLGPAYYDRVQGTVGSDYLLILYRKSRFTRLVWDEIPLPDIAGRPRKPLWLRLKSRRTGAEFFLIANHLLRGQRDGSDDPRRLQEAQKLNEWAKNRSVAAIALGDFNLDFDVNYTTDEEAARRAQQSKALAAMTQNDVWVWVRPDTLIPTQCDPNHDSVLDFAFVAGAAKNWPRESTILEIGCRDDKKRPDHLPVDLVITIRP